MSDEKEENYTDYLILKSKCNDRWGDNSYYTIFYKCFVNGFTNSNYHKCEKEMGEKYFGKCPGFDPRLVQRYRFEKID
jgi:hypothetical protein